MVDAQDAFASTGRAMPPLSAGAQNRYKNKKGVQSSLERACYAQAFEDAADVKTLSCLVAALTPGIVSDSTNTECEHTLPRFMNR